MGYESFYENQEKIKEYVKNAPSKDEGGFVKNSPISFGGVFKMQADSVAFIGDDGGPVVFPRLQESKNGHLMLVIRLVLVDNIREMKAGDHVTFYQPFLASPSSDDDKKQKLINFATPKVKLLTGVEEPQLYNQQWVEEYLTVDTTEPTLGSKKLDITRDHKMKEEVLVEVVMEHDGNKIRPSVKKFMSTEEQEQEVDEDSYKEFKKRLEQQKNEEQSVFTPTNNASKSEESNKEESNKEEGNQEEGNQEDLDDDLPF